MREMLLTVLAKRNLKSSSPTESNTLFFTTICHEAFARGSLLFTKMSLDDKPIAMTCNFKSGRAGFAFKIAFDERYKAQSPGVLHELEVVRYLLGDQTIDYTDSCADPNHPMINHIWRERRLISSFNIARRFSPLGMFFPLLSVARKLYQSLREKPEISNEDE